MNEIGFLGLGAMGRPMAERLVATGYKLAVFDICEAAIEPLVVLGASRVSSIDEMTERCELVIVSLPSGEVVREVLTRSGAFRSGRSVRIVVNTSTTNPTISRDIATACSRQEIAFVDCPTSGGPEGVRASSLSIMVSGDPDAIDTVLPLISHWGDKVTVAGSTPGAAQVLKLVNNMLVMVAIVATSEAVVMGTKAGADPAAIVDAVNAGSGRNWTTSSLFPQRILPRTFDFGSPIDMLMKDVDLAIAQGESLGVPMWVCQAARLVGKHAQFAGHGQDDVSTLVKMIESGAHFKIPRSYKSN